MTNEEREKHIRIANMLIGVINDVNTPMLMYQIEKDVTREALENYIKMLEQQPCKDTVSCNYTTEEIAKSFIEDVESVKDQLDGQTSEDCISREQTLKAFAEKCAGECACCEYNGSGYDNAENCKLIKSMPSVTPSRLKGHWIEHPHECGDNWQYPKYECSKCHTWIEDDSNFCPDCGANMIESEE